MTKQGRAIPSVIGGAPQRGLASLPNEPRSIGLDAGGQQIPVDFETTPGTGFMSGYLRSRRRPPVQSSAWKFDTNTILWDYSKVGLGPRIECRQFLRMGPGLTLILHNGDKVGEAVPTISVDGANDLHPRAMWMINDNEIVAEFGIREDLPPAPALNNWLNSRQRFHAILPDVDNPGGLVGFVGGNKEDAGSIRQWGLARADSIGGSWTYNDNPTMRADNADLQAWGPSGGPIEVAYEMAVVLFEGKYYSWVMTGERSGSSYWTGVFRSASPEGPWESYSGNPILKPLEAWENGFAWVSQPFFCLESQTWWQLYHNNKGKFSFIQSAGRTPFSGWTKMGAGNSYIFDTGITQDNMWPQCYPMEGGQFNIYFSHGLGSKGADQSQLKVVTTNLMPSVVHRPLTALQTDVNTRLKAENNLSEVTPESAVANLLSTSAGRSALWNNLLPNLPTSDPAQSYSPWFDTAAGTLRISPPAPPVISGTAYPGETLTSDVQGEWKVNGVTQTGYENSLTYVVGVDDVGLDITCTALGLESSPLTCWHPGDIAQIQIALLANLQTFVSTDPDVEAAQNEAVLQWNDQTAGGLHATQASSGARALKRLAEVNGNSTLLYQVSGNNYMLLPSGAHDIMQNVTHRYGICAYNDLTPTSGDAIHYLITFTTPGGGARFGLMSRVNSNQVGLYARRLDNDSPAPLVESAQPSAGYHVLTGHADGAAGLARLRVDGVEVATDSALTTGATQDTASSGASIGGSVTGTNNLDGHIACALIGGSDTALTATEMSQLERYAGLLVGLDIPLV